MCNLAREVSSGHPVRSFNQRLLVNHLVLAICLL